MKIISRIAIIGLLQAGIIVALILTFSSSPMAAQEGDSPPNAQPPQVALTVGEETSGAVFAGEFRGNGPFTVVGEAIIINEGPGDQSLRFTEDFRTNRGQRLAVFLRSQSGAVIDLGDLGDIIGGQEFEIPAFTNLSEFNQVQVFDEIAGIDFGTAVLAPV